MALVGLPHQLYSDQAHQRGSCLEKNIVDRYEFLNAISQGSFGVVYRVRDKRTGQVVAMKHKFRGLSKSTWREIAILRSLPRHPSIVQFKHVFKDECDRVFVVMEYLKDDLRSFMDATGKPLILSEVKCMMKQLLEGVRFLHENGVMHRDLKPSNILVNEENHHLKICDFGLSRRLGSESGSYTCHVGTRCYKAPEVLLGEKNYLYAVGMWSVGCIMAELVLKDVLFKGRSELDQIGKINDTLFKDGGLRHKFRDAAAFSEAPVLTRSGFDLLEKLLAFNPHERITAKAILNHGWFSEYYGFSSS